MLSLNEVKTGKNILFNDKPYEVIWSEHSKVGRGGAILRSKIKDLTNGAIIDKTFKGNEKLEELSLERKKYQYLYSETNNFYFMDPLSFEQITLDSKHVGEKSNFLTEGLEVEILFYENNPLSISLPIKMTFEITYTEPGFKGNSKNAITKPAKISTGATLKVPIFVKTGDKIVIDTRTGSYVERA